jgi:phasin family protein
MNNEALTFYKELTEQTVQSVKRLGELNMRTFETLSSKQMEMLQSCVDAGVKQSELLSNSSDMQEYLSVQAELSNTCAEHFTKNLSETADIMKTAQEELSGLVEDSIVDVKQNVAKASEIGKKNVDEVVKAAKPVKPVKKAA